MMRAYLIGGRRIAQRTVIKLRAEERDALERERAVVLIREVEWPLPERRPDFARAFVDEGGTDLWGPGPYLKVPNASVDDDEVVNRLFCPWGYPPQRLRISYGKMFVELLEVGLEASSRGRWRWVLRLGAWTTESARRCVSASRRGEKST